MRNLIQILLISVISFPIFTDELDESVFDEVVVTAQRQEQSLQDVPIAVSAFDSEGLETQQIEGGSDLQLVVPGLQFSPTDSGGSFAIRGLRNFAVGATSDSGVEIHMNDLPMGRTTMQDGNFFDMERVEVLRGPQGTLFGKNSIGGVINLITAKPDTTEWSSSVDFDVYEYDGTNVKAHANLPIIEDTLALRLAFSSNKRDGYVQNIYSKRLDDDIDGRDSESKRASLRYENDRFSATLVHESYDEDSSRNLFNNTQCQRDTSLVVGCTIGVKDVYELTHPMGTYVENIMVAYGLIDFTPTTDMSGAPQGYWEVSLGAEPFYKVDQHTNQLLIDGDITESLSFNISASEKERIYNRQSAFVSEEMQTLRFNDTAAFPGGVVPMSGYGPNCNLEDFTAGIYGGCVQANLTYPTGYDNILFTTEMENVEIRVTSSFDGMYNFMLGAIDTKSNGIRTYDVPATGLDALALVGGGGLQLYPPFYRTDEKMVTDSESFFGELYIQATEDLRFTLGFRTSDDYKESYSRQPFINIVGMGGLGTGFTPLAGAFPGYGEAYIAATGVLPEMDVSNTTGRFVADYFVDEDTMVYGSVSTGVKVGGFNGAIDPILFPDTPTSYPETEITAYETGIKTDFPDQNIRLNASLYYYDIEGFHTTRVVNKVSLTEGIDVETFGLEADILWAPEFLPGLSLNAAVSYQDSEIQDSAQIDIYNADLQMTTANSNWHMMKDTESEIMVVRKDVAAAVYSAWLGGTFAGTPLQAALIPAEFHGDRTYGELTPVSYLLPSLGIFPAEGHLPSLADRAGYAAMIQSLGYDLNSVWGEGQETDLSGNSLTHPEYTLSVGAQYQHTYNDLNITYRADVYHQASRYTRIFNLDYDEIPSWTELNLQVTLAPLDNSWYVQIYGQNVGDEQNLLSVGQNSSAVGLTRPLAAREPERYGMRFGLNF